MERPDSYAAIEEMIQRRDVLLSDLERLIDSLHRQQRITRTEHEALLELARTKSVNRILTPSL